MVFNKCLCKSNQKIDNKVNDLIQKISLMTSFDLATPLQKFFQEFSLSSVINKVITAFSTIFSNIVQILLYVLFLLIDQRFFNAKLNALFPKKDNRIKAEHILTSISKGVRTYIFITTIISLTTGFLTYLSQVLFLCLSLIMIQFVIGNIIYPKLMGNKLNISQFIVILSLVIWGAMWGTIGMFLSVPLMMILLIILSQFEGTKSLAILILGDGTIFSKNK